jgi:hypothetical protein
MVTIDAGSGWAQLRGTGGETGAYDILATSDVDGDGRPEAISVLPKKTTK